eukprot:TRINITY_DN63_c0_g1_i2.p1 TRINITY_DN63_c0_g1~~TRINITY_DN63_c0_g1_i2.p1  ORF type:complete len:626 (-),score=164.69 TRINITY_DN63_c0_g1_i2:243-2120(-)
MSSSLGRTALAFLLLLCASHAVAATGRIETGVQDQDHLLRLATVNELLAFLEDDGHELNALARDSPTSDLLLALHSQHGSEWWWSKKKETDVRNELERRLETGPEVNAQEADIGDQNKAIGEALHTLDAGDVVGATMYGLFNGFFSGMGDAFRPSIRAMRQDTQCQASMNGIKQQVSRLMVTPIKFIRGLFVKEVRQGASKTSWTKTHIKAQFYAMMQLLSQIKKLYTTCSPFREMLGTIFQLVLFGAVVTAILIFSTAGIGAVLRVIAIVAGIVMGIPYIIGVFKKLGRASMQCVRQTPCPKQAKVNIIEAVGEVIGFVLGVIILSGLTKITKVKAIKPATFNKSRWASRFRIGWDPQFVDDIARLKSTMQSKNARAITQWVGKAKPRARPVQQLDDVASRGPKRSHVRHGMADEALKVSDDFLKTPRGQKLKAYDDFYRKNPSKRWSPDLPTETRQAVSNFEANTRLPNGKTYGQSVKDLDLAKIPVDQIDTELARRGFSKHSDFIRDPKTKQPVLVDGQPVPMDVYTNPDGGMVRVKPKGQPNSPRSQPHAVKAVRNPPNGDYRSFAQEAFKVDANGRPIPKYPKDGYNPNPKGSQKANDFWDGWAEDAHVDLRSRAQRTLQ